MPITIFGKQERRLVDQTKAYGLDHTQVGGPASWQQTLIMYGDTDLVVATWASNMPVQGFGGGADEDLLWRFQRQRTLILSSLLYSGKSYPYASRDELLRDSCPTEKIQPLRKVCRCHR